MLSFKPKSNKKIKFNKKSAITLDIKHKEFLNEFTKDEDIILDYKYEIHNLKQKLKDENETMSIEEKLEITDKITELKDNIKQIQSKKKITYLIIQNIFLNILKIKKYIKW